MSSLSKFISYYSIFLHSFMAGYAENRGAWNLGSKATTNSEQKMVYLFSWLHQEIIFQSRKKWAQLEKN